jgi:hypothetical protein
MCSAAESAVLKEIIVMSPKMPDRLPTIIEDISESETALNVCISFTV